MASKNVNIKLGANIKDFESKMRKAQKSFKRTSRNLKKIGKAMTISLTLPLAAFAAASVKAFDTQAKAEASLRTALGENENAFKSLIEQAKELQEITLFGDEETLAAQTMLATMGLEEEAIKRLTPLIQDMATAKGMNLKAAADLVAKSVGSSTNALSRYGIQIEGAVGSTERLDSAVEALSGQFKGQARAAAEAGTGGIKQLQNAFGDFMEQIGKAILPSLKSVTEKLKELTTALNSATSEQIQNAIQWGAVALAIGPVISLFNGLANAVVKVAGFFSNLFKGLPALLLWIKRKRVMITLATRLGGILTGLKMLFMALAGAVTASTAAVAAAVLAVGGLIYGLVKLSKKIFSVRQENDELNKSFKETNAIFPQVAENYDNVLIPFVALTERAKELRIELEKVAQVGSVSGPDGSEGGIIRKDLVEPLVDKLIHIRDVATGVAGSIAESFSHAFAQLIVSGDNFLEGMRQIFTNVANQFAAMIIQAAVLAALMTIITGGSFAGVASTGGTNFMSRFAQGLTGMASGGSVIAGQPYMVGEAGPELFMPGQTGTIIPNNNVGGGSVIPDVRISGSDLVLVFDRTKAEQQGVNG